jgi:Holliday junction resolvase RusA-like endonuclease
VITLPLLPPSINHMYRSIGGARKALTDEALTFRHEVAIAVRGRRAPEGLLACTVQLTFGSKRRGSHRLDADNRIKALADALALALGFDDSRIVEWHIYAQHGQHDACVVALEAAPGTLRGAVVAALEVGE